MPYLPSLRSFRTTPEVHMAFFHLLGDQNPPGLVKYSTISMSNQSSENQDSLTYVMTVPNKKLGFFIAQVALDSYDYDNELLDLGKIKRGLELLQSGNNINGRKLISDHLGYITIDYKFYAAYQQGTSHECEALAEAAYTLDLLKPLKRLVEAIKNPESPVPAEYNVPDRPDLLASFASLRSLYDSNDEYKEIINDDLVKAIDNLYDNLSHNWHVVAELSKIQLSRKNAAEARRQEVIEAAYYKKLGEVFPNLTPEKIEDIEKTLVDINGEKYFPICPITLKLIVEPVKIKEGNKYFYFEKLALAEWIKANTSELDKKYMNPATQTRLNFEPEKAEEMTRAIKAALAKSLRSPSSSSSSSPSSSSSSSSSSSHSPSHSPSPSHTKPRT
jgi:hypothetical protein